MHSRRFSIPLITFVGALLSSGCAHQALDSQVRPEPEQVGGAAADTPTGESAMLWKSAVLVKPENDPALCSKRTWLFIQ